MSRHHRIMCVLLLAAAAIVLAPVSLASRNVPRTLAVRMTLTGEITRLGLDRIAVGRVGCHGKLQSVKYSPELATAQTTRPGGGNAPTTIPTPPPAAAVSGRSSAYSIGALYLGGPPPGETTTVAGTISDVSTSSVTVAGLTCTFKPFPATGFAGPAVGDNVTLICTGGLLIRLASAGVIPR